MDRKNNIREMEKSEEKLNITVDVDSKSGFCYGVVKAIRQAENYLEKSDRLYSLGAIVHNNTELSRLGEKGMEVIDHNRLGNLKDSVVFIRAHGEPPSTYNTAKWNNLRIIDCTCPVVLKLQQRIKESHKLLSHKGGTILIFGNRGHAEVNGLIGQVDGDAVIIEKIKDLDQVDFTKPVTIFSQTTKDPSEYAEVIAGIKDRISAAGGNLNDFKSNNTICRQVSSRHPHLKQFSASHSVILFVSGRESSNGKVLFETCESVNKRCFKIERADEIKREWFEHGDNVGICGATSTPMWLLEEIAAALREL